MSNSTRGSVSTLMAIAIFLLSGARQVDAQGAPASSPGRAVAGDRAQAGSTPSSPFTEDADARETRQKLELLLQKYPPTLASVLKLDPTLLTNEAYLAPYPGLGAFLDQHLEVGHNPTYFLSNVRGQYEQEPRGEREQVYEMMGGVLAGVAAFFVFVTVLTALGWLVRTTINYRRWNRLSKTQTDVHTKLLDRFTQNEDLLAYMQTPAGKRFLESAPIPLEGDAQPIAAPVSRILWSLQAGIVLLVFGLGLLLLSDRLITEVATAMMVFGVMGISLGAGFIISSFAAYFASRRFGLLNPPRVESDANAR
jgi:hypothetical protein